MPSQKNLHADIVRPSSSLRLDIQALRGWAIALVIIDHAKLPIFQGGFLGVDIFFVISGFLMTGLIVRALDNGSFSLPGFYSRRARRLLPAAYSTIVLTAIAAPFLLDPAEMHDFVGQVIGSFTFTANYVLWRQIDYFNNLAALKPLLHMWSLSLEEQYYLFVPVLLLLCATRLRLLVSVVLTAISLALCLYLVQRNPSTAFYFLPTRAWELGLGSVAAILVSRGKFDFAAGYAPILRWFSLGILVVVPIFFDATGHPGAAAIAICLATAWLMASPSPLRENRVWALPVWIGDRSYSLYLLHWPLFAFANNVFVREPDLATRLLLVVACGVLAEIQYRLVEKPFRHKILSTGYLAALAIIPVLVVGSAFAALSTVDNSEDFRAANLGFSISCTAKREFSPLAQCQSGDNPSVLVWGDSFGMHVVPAVVSSTSQKVMQATQPICGPFLGVAPVDGKLYTEQWAKQCITFNDGVFDYLSAHPEIRTVVISSAFSQYFEEKGFDWRLLRRKEDGFDLLPPASPDFRSAVTETVQKLQSLGKRVILIAPPPAADFDIGRCQQRRIEGYPLSPSNETCDFPRAEYQALKHDIIAFVTDLKTLPGLVVVGLDDAICDETTCHTMLDGIPLYRDEAHLSIAGSRLMGEKIGLRKTLDEASR